MSKPAPLSERQLVDRIKPRYEGENGNGPAGCVVAQVRNAAGFDASRTIDALGFHFWPSRGLLIDGFECKSSRSDWTRELENPAKADAFCKLVDRFYIVVGRADLAKVDEVPPDWGLLVPHGDKLKEVKPAVVLHQDSPAIIEWSQRVHQGRRAGGPRPLPPGFDRSFLVAIIGQAYKITNVTPAELEAAKRTGHEQGFDLAKRTSGDYEARYNALRETVREFEQALGYPISGHTWPRDVEPKAVGRTVRAILNGEHEVTGLRNRLNAIGDSARRLADEVERQVSAIDAVEPQQVLALASASVASGDPVARETTPPTPASEQGS